jgi:putative endonuclease
MRKSMKMGKLGENLAAQHLANEGYHLLARNYHTRFGEIDIIALKNQILHFFEVKTRTPTSMNAPEESITYQKHQRLIKTALTYIQKTSQQNELPRIKSWRISLIGILLQGTHCRKIDIIPM